MVDENGVEYLAFAPFNLISDRISEATVWTTFSNIKMLSCELTFAHLAKKVLMR